MDSTFASENESLSEVEILKQQLNTYKMINADLSKKIQDLKVELNLYKNENAKISREVLEERAKAAECRQHFQTMNRHCINFINTYVNTIQTISENDESLIAGIPGLNRTPRDDSNHESPKETTIVPKFERQRPAQHTIRSQLHGAFHDDDDIGSNLLNTILEESMPVYTSTPNVSRKIETINSASKVPTANLPPITPILTENMFETPVQRHSDREIPIIPQNMFESPKTGNSEQTPQNLLNNSNNSSLNDTESPRNQISDSAQQASTSNILSSPLNHSSVITKTPEFQVTSSIRRFSNVPDDEIEEYSGKENETADNDTTEQTIHHETVKIYRVALSPLKSPHLQHNNSNTESPEYENYDDDSTLIPNQTMNISKSLKRKSSETGRPRRRARPDPSQLREPSLRTKLRRSKNKV